MSLNGLDTDEVAAAHAAAIAEPAGWFLLKYATRAEVDLLGSGKGGFSEARDAIARYDEDSPLFGLVVYKKKKALLKYVPDGTSRLLQARLAVHVQSVIEKFPHDGLISLTTYIDLTEPVLATELATLKSSAAVKPLATKSQRHLTEILEDSDDASSKNAIGVSQPIDAGGEPQASPEPVLSPTSRASLESDNAAPRGSQETGTSRSSQRQSGDQDQAQDRPSYESRPSETLMRSQTLESDSLRGFRPPKLKLGPRPSLDASQRSRASGSFSRNVAALPAGIRIAPKSPGFERPRTGSSMKSFSSETGRFSAMPSPRAEAAGSRSNSFAEIPDVPAIPADLGRYGVLPSPRAEQRAELPSPRPVAAEASSTEGTEESHEPELDLSLPPEKARLMKALNQRKKNKMARKASVDVKPMYEQQAPPVTQASLPPPPAKLSRKGSSLKIDSSLPSVQEHHIGPPLQTPSPKTYAPSPKSYAPPVPPVPPSPRSVPDSVYSNGHRARVTAPRYGDDVSAWASRIQTGARPAFNFHRSAIKRNPSNPRTAGSSRNSSLSRANSYARTSSHGQKGSFARTNSAGVERGSLRKRKQTLTLEYLSDVESSDGEEEPAEALFGAEHVVAEPGDMATSPVSSKPSIATTAPASPEPDRGRSPASPVHNPGEKPFGSQGSIGEAFKGHPGSSSSGQLSDQSNTVVDRTEPHSDLPPQAAEENLPIIENSSIAEKASEEPTEEVETISVKHVPDEPTPLTAAATVNNMVEKVAGDSVEEPAHRSVEESTERPVEAAEPPVESAVQKAAEPINREPETAAAEAVGNAGEESDEEDIELPIQSSAEESLHTVDESREAEEELENGSVEEATEQTAEAAAGSAFAESADPVEQPTLEETATESTELSHKAATQSVSTTKSQGESEGNLELASPATELSTTATDDEISEAKLVEPSEPEQQLEAASEQDSSIPSISEPKHHSVSTIASDDTQTTTTRASYLRLDTSKHNSSELASVDGDALFEELKTAKVEQATPMVVPRSPGAFAFPIELRPASRDAAQLINIPSNSSNGSPDKSSFGTANGSPEESEARGSTESGLARASTDSAPLRINIQKARVVDELRRTPSVSSTASRDGAVSPSGRKASGVSKLISARIQAFEKARSSSGSSANTATSVITPSIVSRRKASLTTPPGSSGIDGSPSGSRSSSRAYPTPSPSPHANLGARPVHTVRQSSDSRLLPDSASIASTAGRETFLRTDESSASSKKSSQASSPVVEPSSYFSGRREKKGSISSVSSSVVESIREGLASSSGRRGSRKSTDTVRAGSMEASSPMSPASESGRSSEGESGSVKKGSKRSRLMRRMSSIAMSPRRSIARQTIDETKEPELRKWAAVAVGDVNVQFPDTLLWKRRHMEIDSHGYIVLDPARADKASKVASKRFHVTEFYAPYIPDQDREELPHSIILDFMDSSTLQCACESASAQAKLLQVLSHAHRSFGKKT